jgi:hypothetical protein
VVGGTAVTISADCPVAATTGRVTDTVSRVGKQPIKLTKQKQKSKNLVRIKKKEKADCGLLPIILA